MNSLNILLSSAGRRPYLVDWFKGALSDNSLEGHVILADLDRLAPARARADDFSQAPPVSDANYPNWLLRVVHEKKIGLALSVNDFELSKWSKLPAAEPLLSPLVRLGENVHRSIEDKYEMAVMLGEVGVQVPPTILAKDYTPGCLGPRVVVKGRFGSGSRGLALVRDKDVYTAIQRASSEVTDEIGNSWPHKHPADELIVCQSHVPGVEFGLDVVSDMAGVFSTVLARKKLSMRGGETDRAETAYSMDFEQLAGRIANATQHRGIVDVDVIRDDCGRAWVIDVNPRFGGGYPFSHLAGARIPSAMVAWSIGVNPVDAWLKQESGIVSAKYVETLRLDRTSTGSDTER